MWTCKHCNQEFEGFRTTDKANHSRHCSSNPNRTRSYQNIGNGLVKHYETILGKKSNFKVTCSNCSAKFEVEEYECNFPSKDNYFCSRSCANSVGGRAKALIHHPDEIANYRTVAWRHHKKECIICGEKNIVAVHHLNEDHSDNDPGNLVPMCPTHHQYMHSRFRYLIQEQVDKYVEEMGL